MNVFFIITTIFIFLQVFGYTLTCESDTIKYNLKNKKAILVGMGLQFLVMPFTGYIVSLIFKNLLTFEHETTLLLITTCPGGNQSNFFNSVFNAELGLSLTMTSINSILSLIMIPINLIIYTLALYGGKENVVNAIDWVALGITIGTTIVAFVLGGILCVKISGKDIGVKIQKLFYKIGSISGLALVILAFTQNSSGSSGAFYDQPWYIIVSSIIPVLVGASSALIISRFLMKMPKSDCVTIMIETAMQNIAIALNVSLSTYADDEVALANSLSVAIIYGFAQGITCIIGCLILWKLGWTKAPARENFFVMIFKSYEIKGNNNQDNHESENEIELSENVE